MAKTKYGKQTAPPQQEQPKPINVTYEPFGSQIDVWYALQDKTTTEILHAGSANAGKSYNSVAWIAMMAVMHAGSRWLIGRTKLSDLEGTTLKTLFDLFNDWNITEEVYTYNKQEHVLTLNWNKSEIILKDLAYQPSSPLYSHLGGYEICGAYLDEVNQIPVLAKNIILSRIRYKLKEFNITPKLLMTCNPSRGWVYDEFYEPNKKGILPSYKKFIACDVTDNPKQDAVYLENLNRLDETTRRRLLLGEWEYESEYSLIKYDAILDLFNTQNFSATTNGDYYLSVDVARFGKDSTVIICWNDLNVVEMIELQKSSITHSADKVKLLIDKYNIPHRNIIIDTDGVGGGLADMFKGCINFQANARPLSKENYFNVKTQCAYKLSETINERKIKVFDISQEMKTKLISELEVVKADKVDAETKLCIISKEEMKRELKGKSPDFLDAMLMRMWFTVSNKYFTGEYQIKSYNF